MNTDDIKNKCAQFAKSQLPFLVKLYELVKDKLPKKDQGLKSSDPEDTSEFDIDEVFDEDLNENVQDNIGVEEDDQSQDQNQEEGEELCDDEAKSAKRSKIIRIIAIIAILYFAADEFLLTDISKDQQEETKTKISTQNTQRNKNIDSDLDQIDKMTQDGTREVEDEIELKKREARRVQKEKELSEQGFTSEELSGDSLGGNVDDYEELTDLENQPNKPSQVMRGNNNTDEGLETTQFDKTGYEDLSTEQTNSPKDEVLFKEEDYEDITSEELESEIKQNQTQQEIIESPQDEEIDGVSINILKELEQKLKQKELGRDQELGGRKKDLSLQGRKVPIVDYYQEGRGLVYNCEAGHWACVSEYSYINCREGSQLNNLRNAASSCLPFDVYKTVRDCKRAQYKAMDSEDEKKCRL